jgi:hypothetical protein
MTCSWSARSANISSHGKSTRLSETTPLNQQMPPYRPGVSAGDERDRVDGTCKWDAAA